MLGIRSDHLAADPSFAGLSDYFSCRSVPVLATVTVFTLLWAWTDLTSLLLSLTRPPACFQHIPGLAGRLADGMESIKGSFSGLDCSHHHPFFLRKEIDPPGNQTDWFKRKSFSLYDSDLRKDKQPMYHRTRWTPEKIKQRLELIAPLVYRKQKALSSFRHTSNVKVLS